MVRAGQPEGMLTGWHVDRPTRTHTRFPSHGTYHRRPRIVPEGRCTGEGRIGALRHGSSCRSEASAEALDTARRDPGPSCSWVA